MRQPTQQQQQPSLLLLLLVPSRMNQKQSSLLLKRYSSTILLLQVLYIFLICQSPPKYYQSSSSQYHQSLLFVEGKIDRNVPHGHRGKLLPYPPGPFIGLILSSDDEMTLERGDSVMKQTLPTDSSNNSNSNNNNGGTAICVQDVHAPMTAVWAQILHMEEYPKKVNKVLQCENYHVQEEQEGTTADSTTTTTTSSKSSKTIRIKTKQVLGVLPGYSYESYYDHTFHPEKSSLTWNLDYDKTSDMEDVSGHWHVTEHPHKGPSHSRVYYACDIIMKGHVPKPIFNYISKAALKQATSWVKRESELHPERTVESTLGGQWIPVSSSSATTESVNESNDEKAAQKNHRRRRGWFF